MADAEMAELIVDLESGVTGGVLSVRYKVHGSITGTKEP